ncbi:MAG TPA: hypothetical protein VGP72_09895 [Planctomycetota bacterium]
MCRFRWLLASALLCCGFGVLASEGFDDIVKLVKRGMKEELILSYVETSPVAYNLSAEEIISLRDLHVSDGVVTAIIKRGMSVRGKTSKPASELPAVTQNPGTPPKELPAPPTPPAPTPPQPSVAEPEIVGETDVWAEDTEPAGGPMPPYQFRYRNALYGTLAGYFQTQNKDIKVANDNSIELNVPGFKKPMPVHVVPRHERAPLVVVLLGIDGRADSSFGRLWPSWLANAGCHVLWFDSTFAPSFISISGRGVTGNLRAESAAVADIIAAFLERNDFKEKVSGIGVVGMSYGGIEALVLGELAAAGKLPFKIDAIQSYCPPINLGSSGALIDRWYAEDRWNFTLVELARKFSGHKPAHSDKDIPFDDEMMRAAIALAFRMGLADVIIRNDQRFKLKLLPQGNQFDEQYVQRDFAETWGFQRFLTELAFPYWNKKGEYENVGDMLTRMSVPYLFARQPACTELIMADDDPLNVPDDLAALKALPEAKRILFLPNGGHLGFVANRWTKAKLLRFVEQIEKKEAKARP